MFKDNPFMNTRTLIGFENLLNEILDTATTAKHSNYPPYNLCKGQDQYVIQMAVAGFTQDDLDVEIADNKLTISGERKREDEDESLEFIHAGLAFRSFKRVFTISENIQIGKAELKDGILTLTLNVVIPEEKKPRKVNINA